MFGQRQALESDVDPSGIMELWNDGIMMRAKMFFPNPIFQRSIIPFYHAL
jgi:hypothetical protein